MKMDELKAIAEALGIDSRDAGITTRLGAKMGNLTDAEREKVGRLSIGGNKAAQRFLGYGSSSSGGGIVDDPTATSELFAFDEEDKKIMRDAMDMTPEEPEDTEDILVTSRGVWKLDPKDMYTPNVGGGYAFSKPQGAIDGYVRDRFGGGLGGGTFNLNITVNGATDPDAVGREVVRHVKKSQEQVHGGVR